MVWRHVKKSKSGREKKMVRKYVRERERARK